MSEQSLDLVTNVDLNSDDDIVKIGDFVPDSSNVSVQAQIIFTNTNVMRRYDLGEVKLRPSSEFTFNWKYDILVTSRHIILNNVCFKVQNHTDTFSGQIRLNNETYLFTNVSSDETILPIRFTGLARSTTYQVYFEINHFKPNHLEFTFPLTIDPHHVSITTMEEDVLILQGLEFVPSTESYAGTISWASSTFDVLHIVFDNKTFDNIYDNSMDILFDGTTSMKIIFTIVSDYEDISYEFDTGYFLEFDNPSVLCVTNYMLSNIENNEIVLNVSVTNHKNPYDVINTIAYNVNEQLYMHDNEIQTNISLENIDALSTNDVSFQLLLQSKYFGKYGNVQHVLPMYISPFNNDAIISLSEDYTLQANVVDTMSILRMQLHNDDSILPVRFAQNTHVIILENVNNYVIEGEIVLTRTSTAPWQVTRYESTGYFIDNSTSFSFALQPNVDVTERWTANVFGFDIHSVQSNVDVTFEISNIVDDTTGIVYYVKETNQLFSKNNHKTFSFEIPGQSPMNNYTFTINAENPLQPERYSMSTMLYYALELDATVSNNILSINRTDSTALAYIFVDDTNIYAQNTVDIDTVAHDGQLNVEIEGRRYYFEAYFDTSRIKSDFVLDHTNTDVESNVYMFEVGNVVGNVNGVTYKATTMHVHETNTDTLIRTIDLSHKDIYVETGNTAMVSFEIRDEDIIMEHTDTRYTYVNATVEFISEDLIPKTFYTDPLEMAKESEFDYFVTNNYVVVKPIRWAVKHVGCDGYFKVVQSI